GLASQDYPDQAELLGQFRRRGRVLVQAQHVRSGRGHEESILPLQLADALVRPDRPFQQRSTLASARGEQLMDHHLNLVLGREPDTADAVALLVAQQRPQDRVSQSFSAHQIPRPLLRLYPLDRLVAARFPPSAGWSSAVAPR